MNDVIDPNAWKATDEDTRRRIEMFCQQCGTGRVVKIHPLDVAGGHGRWCDVCDQKTQWERRPNHE